MTVVAGGTTFDDVISAKRPCEGVTHVADEAVECLHCGQDIVVLGPRGFCCSGCEAVYSLLHGDGLQQYYALRDGRGIPVPQASNSGARERQDLKWLEALETTIGTSTFADCAANAKAQIGDSGELRSVLLQVQGLHCAGCVWLFEELFSRFDGGARIVVNPGRAEVELVVSPRFKLRDWVHELQRFGYTFGPPGESPRSRADDLLVRLGVCVALALNAMIFKVAIYLGLASGPVYDLLVQLDFALAAVAVWIGGTVFCRAAWAGLRRGVAHLDLPIAIGIVLAFVSSSISYFSGDGAQSLYLDSLTVFVALMLLGRWLTEAALERNRLALLRDDGVGALLVRRHVVGDGRERAETELARAATLRKGDELYIANGDLIPVESQLQSSRASFSLDWQNGESAPRGFVNGDEIPAGAFNQSGGPITVRTTADFSASSLVALLKDPTSRPNDAKRLGGGRLATGYVAAVLVAGGGGFLLWYAISGSLALALDIACGVLIVACPCAFGVAIPLGRELALTGLRRHGLFVRRDSFFDRARGVSKVVFDKTGTITTGTTEIADTSLLARLSKRQKQIFYQAANASTHPKSYALALALSPPSASFDAAIELQISETPGVGVKATDETGKCYTISAPDCSGANTEMSNSDDLQLSVDGEVLITLKTSEQLRPGAATEIAALGADGYTTFILSGDNRTRVNHLAAMAKIPVDRAIADATPDKKAAWLSQIDDGNTIFIGDGVNDGPAIGVAHCSGTPAVDRPFIGTRSDFFYISAGLAPVRLALRIAAALGRVNRTNIAMGIAYNAGAVSLALLGLMRPWLAAVLMPASALSLIWLTRFRLSAGRILWKS